MTFEMDELVAFSLRRAGIDVDGLTEEERVVAQEAYRIGRSDGWDVGRDTGPDDWYEY